ncbi:MAG: hypothetical protein AAB461_02375 [Patescibacteria group bacterium]
MNTLLSPISGIITVIHLVIIFLAEIFITAKFFWQKNFMGQTGADFNSAEANSTAKWTAPARVKRVLSISIVFLMLTLIIWSTTVTVLKAMNSSLAISDISVTGTVFNDGIILVKTPAFGNIRPTIGLNTNESIFQIINGQKHFIPTLDIFYDYGFDLAAVENITQDELNAFTRVRLINTKYDKHKIYYVTENGMIRLIPNSDVFESYGNREDDIVTVSAKELNFYPRNQYVFVENTLTKDIFQVSDKGIKRYVVPQVVQKLKITPEQAAPINKVQFESYYYGTPIIF